MKTACARALMPDYLRVIALFGIVIVNVQFIAFPTLNNITDPASWTFTDAVVLFLVNGLVILKTYGLFSFMFGVGLGFLMRSSERLGLPFGRIYRNRMIGLAIRGLWLRCASEPGVVSRLEAMDQLDFLLGSLFPGTPDRERGKRRMADIQTVLVGFN